MADDGQMRWQHSITKAGSAAGLLAGLLVASVSLAAPVLSSDDGGTPVEGAGAVTETVPGLSAVQPEPRSPLPVTVPETSTGNKNLDLLLELQGRPGEPLKQQASPASAAAASAALAAYAELRAKAAQRPAPDTGVKQPVVQPFEGAGGLEGDARQPASPPERREWIGGPGSAGGGSFASGGSRYGDAARDPSASGGSDYDADNLIRGLPRDVINFLRDNRYWLLGGLALIAVAGAAIQSYSRRP